MTISVPFSLWVIATSPPWTYWIAPVLLVSTLLLAVATAAAYYRRVAVPGYSMRREQQPWPAWHDGARRV